jgi:DNA processing protein
LISSETKERLIDAITLLTVPGVGRGRFRKLVAAFGSPAQALAAPKSQLEAVPGLSHGLASAIKTECDDTKARQVAARIGQLGWTVLFPDDDVYPAALKQLEDYPVLLFAAGEVPGSDQKMIAMVGTRHATEKGKLFAHWLAGRLAGNGLTVVSGMAEGIDSASHQGALDVGGRTVAVWGTSLEIVYPPSNRRLAEQLTHDGVVFSEYLPDTHPDKSTFPERNRIISGLAEAVIVVEAGEHSGALITAGFALEQGREVFAVPGLPGSENAAGTNALIKRGAHLLTQPEDIFEQLPRLRGEVVARKFSALPDMTDMERKMVACLAEGPQQIDQLSRMTKLSVGDLMGFMLALEIKGIVRELSGKRFVLAE